MASCATCIQRLDGSRDSAIHTKCRISLRSSSTREPRYPLPGVIQTLARIAQSTSKQWQCTPTITVLGTNCAGVLFLLFVTLQIKQHEGSKREPAKTTHALTAQTRGTRRVLAQFHNGSKRNSTMILPQVHLRKPCYDFSFL